MIPFTLHLCDWNQAKKQVVGNDNFRRNEVEAEPLVQGLAVDDRLVEQYSPFERGGIAQCPVFGLDEVIRIEERD